MRLFSSFGLPLSGLPLFGLPLFGLPLFGFPLFSLRVSGLRFLRVPLFFARISAFVLLYCCDSAQASPESALHLLFENMRSAHLSFGAGIGEHSLTVTPTLVRGLYFVRNPERNESLGVVNESGTLVGGGARGFAVFSEAGKPARRLSAEEVIALRAEIMAAIDYDRLVKVGYGNGGGRRILEFSAVDCPSCQHFEGILQSMQSALNTTFYVVPTSLVPINEGGGESWQTAAWIWCAPSNGRAWQNFWARQAPPHASSCRYDGASAQEEAGRLRMILRGAGVDVDYTPTFVLEDGSVVPAEGGRDGGYVARYFGPGSRPPAKAPGTSHWLGS